MKRNVGEWFFGFRDDAMVGQDRMGCAVYALYGMWQPAQSSGGVLCCLKDTGTAQLFSVWQLRHFRRKYSGAS